MNYVAWVMAIFSLVGATDRIFGNRLGLGKEFERGLEMLGALALSMIGMIVISPLIADLLRPVLNAVSGILPIDPSIVPASLFANDMGGAALSAELASTPEMGAFNGLVVAAMMGATVSFTVPFALGAVKKEHHRALLIGLLCGIVTIPVGCFVAGLTLKLPLIPLLINLCPLVVFSGIVALGLLKAPDLSVKIFGILGVGIKILITIGLAIGIFQSLTGKMIVNPTESLENAGLIILNIAAVMTGAFPLIHLLSKMLKRPFAWLGKKLGVGEIAMAGFLSTLATSAPTFDMVNKMDRRGIVLNAAFAVSAAFILADHLAFTLAFNAAYLPAVTLGKAVSGILAVAVAIPIDKHISRSEATADTQE